MPSTITGTHAYGVVLAVPAYTNPVTIAADAVISGSTSQGYSDAVHGVAFAWIVDNYGQVTAPNIGIRLDNGGTVVNAGLISGTVAGVEIDQGILFGPVGNVSNLGTIQGDGLGVSVAAGGTVANGFVSGAVAYGGTITAGVDGVVASGSVRNLLGTISAGRDGVRLTSGALTNGSSEFSTYGYITGGRYGVLIDAAGGSVDNELGSIAGKAAGVASTGDASVVNHALISGGADGVSLAGTGTVANYATITAGTVGVAVFGGTVVNSGMIAGGAGSGSAGVYLDAVKAPATLDDTAGGTISGQQRGVAIAGSAGTVVNAGTLTGAVGDGVYISLAASGYNGYVANSGLMTGGASGVYVKRGSGTVVNFGSIEGANADGIDLVGGGRVSNALAGTVSGHQNAVDIAGTAGAVVNAGTLTGAVGDGVWISLAATGYSSYVANSGVLTGAGGGVYVRRGSGTVINSGTIQGATADGIVLAGGGRVGNGQSAAIAAAVVGAVNGIRADFAAASVANYGAVVGSTGSGIVLDAGGRVDNGLGGAAAAAITGNTQGISVAGGSGRIANAGTIIGGSGIFLAGGGVIVNGQNGSSEGLIAGIGTGGAGIHLSGSLGATIVNYGTISGDWGVLGDAADNGGNTLINAGTIIGSGGTAVRFAGGGDTLIAEPGAVFVGIVDGNTLELAAGPTTGTLTSLGTQFVGFTQLKIDARSSWQIDGAVLSQFVNDGTIIVAGQLDLGAVGQDPGMNGVIELGGGATIDFAAGVARGQSLVFAGPDASLAIDRPRAFHATISGLAAGDTIDLVGHAANGLAVTAGVLKVTDNGKVVADLRLFGSYTAADFTLVPDGQGGTDILFGTGPEIEPRLAVQPDPWVIRG